MLHSSINCVKQKLKTNVISKEELLKSCLARINKIKSLNAFISVLDDNTSQNEKTENPVCFQNIPFAVKDNFCTADFPTTCASKMLSNFKPNYNATVVDRLIKSGAKLIGKCNLDEFAMGSGTTDSYYGPTKNIWGSNISYTVNSENKKEYENFKISGGSSGGVAVAVATGACYFGIGSDTGGSTRNPAAYCGIVGFKPTYSSVSRYGLIPLVNSMDVPGILARNVEDIAFVYNIICGYDSKDSTTDFNVKPVNINDNFDVKNIKIGIPKEFHCQNLNEEISTIWKDVVNILNSKGANIKSISLPHIPHSIACYSILNQCEVASNMARYDGLRYGYRASESLSTNKLFAETRREGLNKVVKGRILAGNYFLLQENYEYLEKAMKVRRLIHEEFKNAWREVDFILTPTTLSDAPVYEEFIKLDNREQCSVNDFCTQPANMTGCPAISIPIALSKNELPLSLQLMSPNFEDEKLLLFSKWLEKQVCFPQLHIVE